LKNHKQTNNDYYNKEHLDFRRYNLIPISLISHLGKRILEVQKTLWWRWLLQTTSACSQSFSPTFHDYPTCGMWQSNNTHHLCCPERLLWQMDPKVTD